MGRFSSGLLGFAGLVIFQAFPLQAERLVLKCGENRSFSLPSLSAEGEGTGLSSRIADNAAITKAKDNLQYQIGKNIQLIDCDPSDCNKAGDLCHPYSQQPIVNRGQGDVSCTVIARGARVIGGNWIDDILNSSNRTKSYWAKASCTITEDQYIAGCNDCGSLKCPRAARPATVPSMTEHENEQALNEQALCAGIANEVFQVEQRDPEGFFDKVLDELTK